MPRKEELDEFSEFHERALKAQVVFMRGVVCMCMTFWIGVMAVGLLLVWDAWRQSDLDD